MSFRIEQKLSINSNQIFEFKKWMKEKNYKKLYNDRIINSLYFENISNTMFLNSEEGILPRKKIRVRNYPESIKKEFFLENKISSAEGRFKTQKIISKQDFEVIKKKGLNDIFYSFCFPKLYVTYQRSYYDCLTFRLTIDTNIVYKDYINKNHNNKDHSIVVEIKANVKHDLDSLMNSVPFQRIRFSKYSRAFISLYK